MKYNTLLFDADETLFDFKKSERIAFSKTMIDFGFDYQEALHLPIYDQVNTAIWKEFERGEISQEILKIERFSRLSNILEVPFDPHKFAKAYMAHLSKASYIYPETSKLLAQLYNNYTLAIITNGLYEVQKRRIGLSNVASYFKAIVISEQVGLSKPTSEIFNLTLAQLNVSDKSKVLMIGDSLTSDILGGINAGLDTCWFNPNKQINSSAMTPTYEIHALMDLFEVLT